MKNSCGAILYTFNKEGTIGIILGSEGFDEWLPFKGCNEEGESFEQTAIREIREETCGLVNLDTITLDHVFTTKHKIYRIGLCHVDYDIIEKFDLVRKAESREEFIEKQEIRFFALESIFIKHKVHSISRASIKFYWDKLMTYAGKQAVSTEYIRCHGMTEDQAKDIRAKALNDISGDAMNVMRVQTDSDEYSNSSDKSPLDRVDDQEEKIDRLDKANVDRLDKANVDRLDKANVDRLDVVLVINDKSINNKTHQPVSAPKQQDLPSFLAKRELNYKNRRKSSQDSRGYTRREYNLSRPKRVGIYYTPMAEQRAEENRSWR